GGTTFLIFAIMMVLQLLFVLRLMPETKGKSLEMIQSVRILICIVNAANCSTPARWLQVSLHVQDPIQR
ncbi:MAG: MFS transporter, partial [Cyclobacteriaceae bacterium]|nr:MFS transporter [Cyclobacteriaceae bacterium]